MNISKNTLLEWDSLQSIATSFHNAGFDDIKKHGDTHIDVSLEANTHTILRIIKTTEPFTKYFNALGGQIRYLLLFNEIDVLFVKQEMSILGIPKKLKFKFSRLTPQNSTIKKLKALKFNGISEFNNLFDTKEIVKKFYEQYKEKLNILNKSIIGIKNDKDRMHYAQLIFYRLIFIYFIQTNNFLSNDEKYLQNCLKRCIIQKTNFYDNFLKILFFNVLNTPKANRSKDVQQFIDVPFLNGGLFHKHRIESENNAIAIKNDIFDTLLIFLSKWIWYVDETTDHGGDELSVNPEILGNIFEKTIADQKGTGAYYTPIDVTKYITERTILPYCVDMINKKFDMSYLILNDIKDQKHLQSLYFDVIKELTILDNACGSGEFLLSASKLLYDLYNETWKKIKTIKSKQIIAEHDIMSKSNSPEYYFKRRIISFNLFGVDLEEDATEICKLRLWLFLVSEMKKDTAEPLPNVDYNIMIGNSIIGYLKIPKLEQYTLDSPTSINDLIAKIDGMKDKYKIEDNPMRSKKLKNKIDSEILLLDKRLTKSRNASIFSEKIPLNTFEKFKPFHWILHFGQILKNNGGFDIIIGNPPYVERSKLGYPVNFLNIASAGSTYAYFFEISIQLLKNGGRLGLIVPISAFCTQRMKPLIDLMESNANKISVSHFGWRPSKIFPNVNRAVSILIQDKNTNSKNCEIYSTTYNKWYTTPIDERPDLFNRLEFLKINKKFIPFIIPKIGFSIEQNILTKIFNFEQTLKSYVVKNSKHKIYYRTTGGLYWKIITDFQLEFYEENGTRTKSSRESQIYFSNKKYKQIALAIYNSNLYWWYYTTHSNCRDLNPFDLTSFPIDIDSIPLEIVTELQNLVAKLMIDLTKNSQYAVRKHIGHSPVKYQVISPKKSKNIIDSIDRELAKIYGFDDQETNFLINYDKKFRLSEIDDE